jgi:hypothetical protein
LIIGINQYWDDSIPDLENPINDAKKLHQVLTTTYNFKDENITLLQVEKISKDLIRVLVLADFYLEFNSSLEFRDYINSNFDEFNENFLPLYVLKKLKLDSYLEL